MAVLSSAWDIYYMEHNKQGLKTGLCKQFAVTFLAAEIHLEYMVLMWTDM